MRKLLGIVFAGFSVVCVAQPDNLKEQIIKSCEREYQAYQTAYLPFSSWCRVQVESGKYPDDADCKAHGYLIYNHDRPKAAFAFKACANKVTKE